MTVLAVCLALVLGACIGSFLGVVAWRVPRGESIVRPPSHCSECGHELRPSELVPVVSYLRQHGRCTACGAEIPVSALLIELGAAAVFAAIAAILVS